MSMSSEMALTMAAGTAAPPGIDADGIDADGIDADGTDADGTDAESVAPESGTEAPFTLGAAEAATGGEADNAPEPDPTPDAAEPTPDAPPRKVLIVEDTTELAEVIQYTLENINVVSFHETHGERALEVYDAQEPDIVLLDIGLPDMTGWKLLDAIKARREGEYPPIVVITAHGDPANRLMGKLQGVHSYLIKPFTPDDVETVVQKALAGGDEEESEAAEDTELPAFVQKMMAIAEAEADALEAEAADSAEDEPDSGGAV